MTTVTTEPILSDGIADALGLAELEPVTLDEVVDHAALLHRVDRKYLVPVNIAGRLVAALADSHAVLQIDGRRATTYRSTYFDTATYTSSRSHVQRRRLRWKVRSRLYVEDRLCRIEVKMKNGRGATVKTVGPSDVDRYGQLSGDEHQFVREALAGQHPDVDVDSLVPSAEVTYARATLVDIDAGARVTIDWRVNATLDGGSAWIDEKYVLVETKGGAVPARADRILAGLGARPRAFSKYVAATSLIRPEIADNDLRHLQGTSLHHRLRSSPTNGNA